MPPASCCICHAMPCHAMPLPHCSCCNHSCVPNAEAFKREEDEDGSGACTCLPAC